MSDWPDFVTPIPFGTEPSDVSPELPPERRHELDRKLREFAKARARALHSARDYFVTGGSS